MPVMVQPWTRQVRIDSRNVVGSHDVVAGHVVGMKVAESVLPLLLNKGMANPSTEVRAIR